MFALLCTYGACVLLWGGKNSGVLWYCTCSQVVILGLDQESDDDACRMCL